MYFGLFFLNSSSVIMSQMLRANPPTVTSRCNSPIHQDQPSTSSSGSRKRSRSVEHDIMSNSEGEGTLNQETDLMYSQELDYIVKNRHKWEDNQFPWHLCDVNCKDVDVDKLDYLYMGLIGWKGMPT